MIQHVLALFGKSLNDASCPLSLSLSLKINTSSATSSSSMAFLSCSSSPYLALSSLINLLSLAFFCFDRAHSLQFSFSTFSSGDPLLQWSNNSNVDNQALQVTRNSATSDVSDSSGQTTYSRPLQLRHTSYDYLASFNTSFLINMGTLIPVDGGGIITNNSNSSGGGMTFMLSSDPAISYLPNSFGQWLGLFDASATQQEAAGQRRIVAIEFDTFKDSFDPDANHVGIDVNGSVDSIHIVSLSPLQVTLTNLSTTSGIYTSIWIDYNGHLRTIDVYLANQGSQLSSTTKPETPAISSFPIDLSKYLPDTIYVGFSASVGTILESHCVAQWNFNSTDFPARVPLATILGCIFGALALLVAGVLALLYWKDQRARANLDLEDLITNLEYGPRKFPYSELKKATKGFSDECKLGQGGFGAVYMGVIRSKDGKEKEVAVKCLSHRSKQGEKEFKAEVMSMGRMRHKNLVQLLGWSYGRGRLMLVYEYMPNKSLDKWIGPEVGAEVMGWERRYNVMKGVSAGLLYLHEEWEKVVVHRDLKPSNVMLDMEFNARIGDFGLAKLFETEQDIVQTATVAGTPGYMAPECMDQGIISKEVDIYSLGVMAIELATGRRISAKLINSLLSLVFDNSTSLEEVADPKLPDGFNPRQLELLLKLGLACCQPDASARPTIREVMNALSSSGKSFSSTIACTPSMFPFFNAGYRPSLTHILDSTTSSLACTEMELTGGR